MKPLPPIAWAAAKQAAASPRAGVSTQRPLVQAWRLASLSITAVTGPEASTLRYQPATLHAASASRIASASRLNWRKLRTLNGSIAEIDQAAGGESGPGVGNQQRGECDGAEQQRQHVFMRHLEVLEAPDRQGRDQQERRPGQRQGAEQRVLRNAQQPVPAERLASRPRNSGNSTTPAPAGAGTPVKKLRCRQGPERHRARR